MMKKNRETFRQCLIKEGIPPEGVGKITWGNGVDNGKFLR